MKFEWDDDKNRSNILKHGIDFADVPQMFDFPMIVELDDRVAYDEERWVGLGMLNATTAVVVYVERSETTIRIISARRANKYERKTYSNRLGAFGKDV